MTKSLSKERTQNYLRQIKGTVVFRVAGIAVSFVTIPLIIRCLGHELYGVWSTMLTAMSWIVFFDLGVGNGLRNKVAESVAMNNTCAARGYIASGYAIVGVIALILWTIFFIGAYYVPWGSVLNTGVISESKLREAIQISVFFVSLNFWVGLITALLGAIQKTSLIALGQLGTNLLILLLVFIFSKSTNISITYLSFIYGFSLVSINIFLSLWFYKNNPKLRPNFYEKKCHFSPLLTVGLQFFVIQLAVLVIFTTDKIVITQIFGPKFVTEYEIVFKLFSIITFVHNIISAPMWSAYTDAYLKNDYLWIKNALKKQLFFFIIIILFVILLMILAESIIKYWIGDNYVVSISLVVFVGLYVVISVWNNIFAMIVNGLGKIKLQLYSSVFAMLINIPLSIFYVKITSLGVGAVVLGTISSLLIAAIVLPVQVYFEFTSNMKIKNA